MSDVSPHAARALLRAQSHLRTVKGAAAANWLGSTYRQHLLGGWMRPDLKRAKPHKKALAFHEAEKALFCPGMPGEKDCGEHVGQIGEDWNETFDCPKCGAKGLKIPPRRTGPGVYLVAAPTYSKHFPLVNNPYLEERLSHLIETRVVNQQKVTTQYILKDGTQIHCLSYEQEIRKAKDATSPFEGAAWDGVWFDEPPTRGIWIATKRGLMNSASKYLGYPYCKQYKILFAAGGNRSGKSHHGSSAFSAMVIGERPWDKSPAPGHGRVFITATPLECPWMFHEVYKRAWNRGGDAKHVFAMEFTIYDNPSLTEEAIDQIFKDGLDENEIASRIYGKFKFLSGRIYQDFDQSVHVYSNQRFDPLRMDYRPQNDEPSPVPIIHTVDPHPRKPWAMTWHAVMPDGSMICVDEWPKIPYEKVRTASMGYDDYAKVIAETEAAFPGGPSRVIWRDLDPNISRTPTIQDRGTSTIRREMADRGYRFRDDVNDKLSHGHNIVRTRLRYDTSRQIDELNRPMYMVEEGCRNTIFGFENYSWEEQTDIDKAPKERPKDIGKDFMDTVRYACSREPKYVDWRNRGEWYANQKLAALERSSRRKRRW